MKPNPVATVTHVGQSQSEHRMQIDPLATVHLMSVLENLYSDPIKAVIREYSTNARDSHIDAGTPERPIKVMLPSERRLFFEVEDFGLGLNVDDLANVYSMYGRSTKRESDAVNGMLGLGCKSAFTYSQQFHVTAVKDGVKTLAVVLKDADGVGTIKILDTVGTDEPNGVKVSVPVRQHHVRDFAEKAAAFYRYWEPGTVLVNGETPDFLRQDEHGVWVDEDIVVSPGGNSFLVMGNVAYPFRHGISGLGIVAWVPMGSVNFVPSREALHETDNTKSTSDVVERYVRDRLAAVIAPDIKALPPFERLKKALAWRSITKIPMADFISDFGAAPFSRHVMHYSPNNNYRRSRKTYYANVTWDDLTKGESPHIIFGYPHRTITPMAKERLEEVYGYSAGTFLLVDDTVKANLDGVAGRPGVVRTWDEIIALTPDVKPQRAKREKVAFAYNVYHQGRFERTTEIDADATILWTYTNDTHYVSKYPEAFIVELRSNQVDKFKRLFPAAQSAYEYHTAQIEAARAAITEEDRLFLSATQHGDVVAFAKGIKDHEISTPIADGDLALVLDALTWGESQALVNYQRILGHMHGIEAHPLPDQVMKRYPLFAPASHYSIERDALDFVIYVNAKHASTQEVSK